MSAANNPALPGPAAVSNVTSIGVPALKVQRGLVVASLGNATTILTRADEWRGVLAWDPWAGRVRVMKPPPRHSLDGQGPDPEAKSFWTDRLTDRAAVWIEHHHNCVLPRDVLARAVDLAAEGNIYHPIQEYLESLTWDRKKRLDTWLVRHARAADTPYTRAVGKLWMLSCVARIYKPGTQVDYVLILEGDQRSGKSSLFRALCRDPEWFLETSVELGTKDAYQMIRAKWIVELAELDSLSRSEFSRVKAFITAKVDTYRKSYGREVIDVPRGCVFGGTVNEQEYLKDETGGGRWWPVWTPATQTNRLDTAKLIEERDQLWAEAVHRFKKGEKWHPEEAGLVSIIQAEQEARRQRDPLEETIEGILKARPKLAKDGVSVSFLLQTMALDSSRQESMRVAKALTALGWRLAARPERDGKRVKLYRPRHTLGGPVKKGGPA